MSKKVLVVYFTQSGQMKDIIDHFTGPLQNLPEVSMETVRIFPEKKFPFPWTTKTFFEAMPHSVDGIPEPLEAFSFKENKYDLIIVGYQPWFLSPGIPINSLLMHPHFKTVAKDTPVITISGCRNMWINAQEKIKIRLKEANARLAGNIALVDRHDNYSSLVTIFYWMLTGKKDRKWGIFPRPGVSDEDIANSAIFGETVKYHLLKNEWDTLQEKLVAQKAVDVRYYLMFIERKAGKIFKIWSGIIAKKKNKGPWLVAFKYYILIALFVAAPVILLVDALFFKPFLGKRIQKQKAYYAGTGLE
ncbi:MAG: hypothetical protein KF862_24020 [Chitinophagaceae bacterium]|nr:hypothetical protein [Chitinophagaceae bacterium]